MALLGTLPASTSPQFSLNALDWKKVGRMALVQAAGLLIGVAPMLAGFQYKIHGVDLTPVVLMGINLSVEVLRRFTTK